MAITIQHSDVYGSFNKGTSSWIAIGGIIPLANFAVGDWVIAIVAADTNTGPTAFAWNNGQGSFELFSTPVAALNSGNVSIKIVIAKILTKPTNESYITVTGMTTGDSKVAQGYIVRGLHATSPFDASSTGTGTSTSPSSGASATLAQSDEIVIGGVGTEGPYEDTAGTWTTGTGNVSGNEKRYGTTGGGAASNITCSVAAEIVSATTAQTAAKTGITSRDWAAAVATFKGAAAATARRRALLGVGL